MKEVVVVYLGNILIFTRTAEKYKHAVQRVLAILVEYKLFLWPEKYEFQRTCIEYIGLVIAKNEVTMDPVKVAGVRDWSTPKNQTDI